MKFSNACYRIFREKKCSINIIQLIDIDHVIGIRLTMESKRGKLPKSTNGLSFFVDGLAFLGNFKSSKQSFEIVCRT